MTAYRTYETERKVFGKGYEPVSILEARDIADKLCAEFGKPPVQVDRSRNRNSGERSWFWYPTEKHPNGRIALGTTAPVWIVCHEVAHYLNYPSRGHRKDWKIKYVECVRIVLGDLTARRLHRAFRL